MELNRTGSIWDRLNRNGTNQNWETIEEFMNIFDGSQLIERSYNLINKDALVPGVLNSAGELVPSDSTSTTEFIPFPPNAYYNVKPTGKLTQFYDKDYNVLAQHFASDNFPVISPNGTAYVRSSITNTRIDETYAYQGADDRPYIDYGFKYADSVYDADFIREVKEQIEIAKKLASNNLKIEKNTQLFDKNSVTMDYSVDMKTGELVQNPSFYASDFIPVLPGEKLMILPTIGQSAFYDLDYNFLSGFNSLKGNPINIPSNAYYLVTSGYITSLETKMVYIGTEEIPYQEFGGGTSQMDVFSTNQLSFNTDGFPLISTPYDATSNIEYTFGQLGINEFYHLQRIKTDYFNQLVSSDHISPYRIKAVRNPIADNSVIVTGGNHGSDGGGGGFPTGRPISIDVYIDNKKITSGTHNTNSPIVVKVVNEACAYNTVNTTTGERRDVLRETITYTFYPNVQTVSIDMEALEPIEFYGHRGISMQRHNHKQFAYVPTDSNGQVNAGGAFDFHSTSEGSDGDRIVQYNADNHLAVMFLDERIGLGDFELNTVDPRWFMSSGKTYSNTIEQGKYHAVATNEILTLSGGYHFGKGLDMPGNGKAYHIIRGGKRVYCADDFYTRSGYIEVLPEDVNKEVKVIKNVGYTVDGFTTSKGLKFSKSSGAGTLMFEVSKC